MFFFRKKHAYLCYIEELGTETVDIFNICKTTGLQPPVFDIDAQHFMVTVYRPVIDGHGKVASVVFAKSPPCSSPFWPILVASCAISHRLAMTGIPASQGS